MHQFDNFNDPNPWGEPWAAQGDRISASIINGHMRPDPDGRLPLYSRSLAGTILSPTANTLVCGFAFDAGTVHFHNPAGCGNGGQVSWCNLWADPDTGCAWAPEQLAHLMDARNTLRDRGHKPRNKWWDDGKFYDELIFDAAAYTRQLPHSLEAVFYLEPSDCTDVTDGPKCTDYAIAAHATILEQFGLERTQLPLLKLDLANTEGEPFSDHAYESEER